MKIIVDHFEEKQMDFRSYVGLLEGSNIENGCASRKVSLPCQQAWRS